MGNDGMVEREVEVANRLGLHARAAAKLVHAASRFESDITLVRDGEEVDAKSILGVLLLAAGQGALVTIRCRGSDEESALEAMAELVSSRLTEEE